MNNLKKVFKQIKKMDLYIEKSQTAVIKEEGGHYHTNSYTITSPCRRYLIKKLDGFNNIRIIDFHSEYHTKYQIIKDEVVKVDNNGNVKETNIETVLKFINDNFKKENDFIKEKIKENDFIYYLIYIKNGYMQDIHDFNDIEEAQKYACDDDVFSRDLHHFTIEINDEYFEISRDHEAFDLLVEHFWG